MLTNFNMFDPAALENRLTKIEELTILDQLKISQIISNRYEVNGGVYPVSADYLRLTLTHIMDDFKRLGMPKDANSISTHDIFKDRYITLNDLLGRSNEQLLTLEYNVQRSADRCTVDRNSITLHEEGHKGNLISTDTLLSWFLLDDKITQFIIAYDSNKEDGFPVSSVSLVKSNDGNLNIEQYELYADLPISLKMQTEEDYDQAVRLLIERLK